jgi:hypothetical protein
VAAIIAVDDPDQAARTDSLIPENSTAALRAFWVRHFFLLFYGSHIEPSSKNLLYQEREKK